MHFAAEDCQSELLVRAFQPGKIHVGVNQYTNSVIIHSGQPVENWRPQQFEVLCREDFECLLPLQSEVILFGSGNTLRFPHPSITSCVLEASTGLEIMDTAAACRTFNILLSEGRSVIAVLLLQ